MLGRKVTNAEVKEGLLGRNHTRKKYLVYGEHFWRQNICILHSGNLIKLQALLVASAQQHGTILKNKAISQTGIYDESLHFRTTCRQCWNKGRTSGSVWLGDTALLRGQSLRSPLCSDSASWQIFKSSSLWRGGKAVGTISTNGKTVNIHRNHLYLVKNHN